MATAADVTKIAKAEVGTKEARSGGHWVNNSKYNKWFGKIPGYDQDGYGYPWCAVFVAWVAAQAGDASLYPKTAGCATAVAWFKSRKRFSEYPAVGAQVFFGPGGGTHTGLVVAYTATTITTVEGNTNTSGSAEGDGVYLKTRQRRDSYVYGYGYPAFAEGIKSADPAWSDKPAALGIKGIDVSSYQSETYDLAGAEFVAVKATEGDAYTNPKREAQVKRARDAKRVVGHYHFLRPGDMKKQIDFFLKVAAPLASEFLALDWEDAKVSCADKDAALKYLQSKAAGRKVLLYCNTQFWLNKDTSSFAADGLWIAQYSVKAGAPAIEAEWLMHQYTDKPVDTSVTRWATRSAMAKWATPVATKPAEPAKPKPAKPVVDLSDIMRAAKNDPTAPQGHQTYSAGVKIVEAALKAAGYLAAKYASDGSYGTTTIDAYKKWQRKLGYKGADADGIPGTTSLTRLGAKHGFGVKP
ncbi:GH25 family lysozyme [Streptomyces sp. NPDC055006]